MKELALNHLPELAPRTVESLNLLRLRLEQTAPDAKIILLTSTIPQEGKTTLALQFWQLLAGLGQRCLLVDGDLRHSGICRQCGLTGEHKVPGLAHYLSGSVPLEKFSTTPRSAAPAWFRPPAPPAARPCCWNTPVLPTWWKAVPQSLLIFW